MQTEGAENTSRKQKLCLKKSCNKRSKWSQTRLFDTVFSLAYLFPFIHLTHLSLKGSLLLREHPSFTAKTTFIQNHVNHLKLPNGTALDEVPTMQQSVLGTQSCQSLDVSHSRPNLSVVSCIFPPNSLPPHWTSEPDTSAMSLESLPDPYTVGMKWNRLEKFSFFKRKGNETSQVLLDRVCLQQWPQSQQGCRSATATAVTSIRPSILRDCTKEWHGVRRRENRPQRIVYV